ncbi:MAG: hypothetical protein VX672_00110, partial [Planctomycetota bacterium]|nr:hypothetical protein [Planctomycetota bacterium]
MTEQWPSRTTKITRSRSSIRVGIAIFLTWAGGCAAPPVERDAGSSEAAASREEAPGFTTGSLAGDLFGGAIMPDPGSPEAGPGPGGPAPSEVAATLASAQAHDDPEVDPGIGPEMGLETESAGEETGLLATTIEAPEVVDGIPTSRYENRAHAMPIAELDRRLRTAAADADDPMPFEVVRALLAILALDELELGEETRFAPASIGLLSEEEDLLAAVRAFAEGLRERLAKGEDSSRDILLGELQNLLVR